MCNEKHGFAMPGDWISWIGSMDSPISYQGRVIGQMKSADGDTRYIVVLGLCDSCFVCERWVEPLYVSSVKSFRSEMLSWFSVDSEEWNKRDKTELRTAAERAPWMTPPSEVTRRASMLPR